MVSLPIHQEPLIVPKGTTANVRQKNRNGFKIEWYI